MKFEIEQDYTVEDFDAYWRGFFWKRPEQWAAKEASPQMLRLGGWFFVVGGVISLFAWPMFRDLNLSGGGVLGLMMRTPLGGILELVVGVSLLRQSRRPAEGPESCSNWARRNWKRWQKSGEIGICVFTGEDFQVRNARGSYRCNYTELDKLWEDEGHFYLVLRKRSTYILPKAKFTAGNPADLPAFWRERTGKPVEQVK